VRFEVLIAVILKDSVFWDVMPSSLHCQNFRGACYLQLQGGKEKMVLMGKEARAYVGLNRCVAFAGVNVVCLKWNAEWKLNFKMCHLCC
jgi:hypothetical protein